MDTARLSQGPCDMKLGPGGAVGNSTVLMPSVLAKLVEIGKYITMEEMYSCSAKTKTCVKDKKSKTAK